MTADSHQGVFGTNLFKTVHWIIEKKKKAQENSVYKQSWSDG